MVGKLTPMTSLSCSRLPAVLGLSPYSTANDELAKTVDALAGKAPAEWTPNESADWGNRLEQVILDEVAKRLYLDTLLFPTEPFFAKEINLAASLDGIGHSLNAIRHSFATDEEKGIYVMTPTGEITVSGPGVLESKLTSESPEIEPAAHRGPIQLQGCMICSGYTWGAIGVLYRGTELRVFVYPRDEDMCARIAEAVDEFDKRKLGPDWYPPTSTADAARVWQRVEEDAPPINLPQSAVELIDEILVAKEVIKASEEIVDDRQAQLMEMLGNHETGFATDSDGTQYRVRWPSRTYKAQPEKIVPAKEAYTIRLKSVDIKVVSNG